MTVFVSAHCTVFRSLFEDLQQVRHILVDIFFKVDDDTLLRIFEQVGIIEAGREDEFRKRLEVGHLKSDLVTPLIAGDRIPIDMDIGLFFQSLEDRPVVRIGFSTSRIVGHTFDRSCFC